MPDIITTYNELSNYSSNGKGLNNEMLFWIIEYNSQNPDFDESERYSLLRNECLKHPINFKERLDNGTYKIWTRIPY